METIIALSIINLRIKQFPITPCPHETFSLLKLTNSEVLGVGLDNSEGVGVTHAALPALDNDDGVARGQDVKLKSVVDSPLDSAVNILLPVDLSKVGLLLGE